MTPFVTEDYDMLKAFCDYRDIALFEVTESLMIQDCNYYATRLFDKSQIPPIQQNFKCFLEQHQLLLPSIDYQTAQYHCTPYETLTLKWSVLPQPANSTILYAAEVTNNAIHSAVFTDQVFSILNDCPVAIYCKDLYGTYVESNHYCDFIAHGNRDCRSVTGSTDNHLIWAETAADLQQHDSEAMSGHTKSFQEEIILSDGTPAIMQSTKSPLLDDQNKIIGMIGISVNTTLFNQNQSGLSAQSNHSNLMSTLSSREKECAHWLLQGLSARQAAQNMRISKRTAEAHINNIKLKTNSYKLFQAGFRLGLNKL